VEVIICPDADEVGRVAAAKVARVCADEEHPVLGLATGSSPLSIYAHLAARVEAGELDLSAVDAFALDEYVGLDPAHPESYHSVIARTVTEPLRMDPSRVHVPDGAAADIDQAARAYEEAIAAAGGVSVQILGIGTNGHIGFNEPTSSFASRTRIKTLAERTRLDNQRFFDSLDDVPRHCLTQGLGTIMDARHLLLVAQGAAKARAVAATVEGPVSAVCPASILQHHERATVVLDEEAASGLRLREYYQQVYAHKPGWQRYA
jgi:glucosamine-6-phosphate deaminase